LQEKPLQLLTVLVENPQRLVTRAQLRERMWDSDTFVDYELGINVAIKKLRHALGDSADEPKYIQTIAKKGYKFLLPVEVIEQPKYAESLSRGGDRFNGEIAASAAVPASAPAFSEPAVAAEPTRPQRSQESRQPPFFPASSSSSSRAEVRGWLARLKWWGVAVVAVALVSLGLVSSRLGRPGAGYAVRAVISLPDDLQLMTRGENAGIAISPDGTQIAFSAVGQDGRARLWLRRLDSLTPEPIAGTEGGAFPFWSPDGRNLGFFTTYELKRVGLDSNSVSTICESDSGRGGTWSQDGVILFAQDTRSPIYRIPAVGGTAAPVTVLDEARFTTHRWPAFLPDGNHFLFLAANHSDAAAPGTIYVGSLDGSPPRPLGEPDSNMVAVGGAILFLSRGKLLSQKLSADVQHLEAHADVLAETVEYDPGMWYGTFTASADAVVYRARPQGGEQEVISWFDRKGNNLGEATRPGIFRAVSLAPDAKTIAALCGDPEWQVCLVHADGTITQLTNSGINCCLVWARDSSEIAYDTHNGQDSSIAKIKPLDGVSPERVIAKEPIVLGPADWHPDKRHLLVGFADTGGKTYSLSILDLETGKLDPYLSKQSRLLGARFSPDGNWVAYEKNVSGQEQIYISSYPVADRTYRIPGNAASAPRWRGDGREIYFLGSGEILCAASVSERRGRLALGAPQPLFRPLIFPAPLDRVSYDVNRDGTKFVINTIKPAQKSELILASNKRE
jgi:DNA-binding winged helix-turn-helix (wHTH) protein/Tol biopolymer transport system component